MAVQWRRSLPWPALCAGAILFTACALLMYESAREYLPRRGLPHFDMQRGSALSAEHRAAYERELFSELSQWNRPSRHYPTHADVGQRERRWRRLAAEGLELAHITLQVLQPDGGFVYPLDEPMRQLQVLAEEGDAGAMCLMTGLVGQSKRSRVAAEHIELARQWLLRGAERGHAECLLQLGRRLLLWREGLPGDTQRGLSLDFAARRAGYAHDVDGLTAYFQRQWSSEPVNLARLYCWLSIDAKSRIVDGPQHMLAALRADAQRTASRVLEGLADQLQHTQVSLQACVDMGVR